MPNEEVFVLGGWNSRKIAFFDGRKGNYFERIMEIDSHCTFNVSSLKYIEALKYLVVGDCFSNISVFRYLYVGFFWIRGCFGFGCVVLFWCCLDVCVFFWGFVSIGVCSDFLLFFNKMSTHT